MNCKPELSVMALMALNTISRSIVHRSLLFWYRTVDQFVIDYPVPLSVITRWCLGTAFFLGFSSKHISPVKSLYDSLKYKDLGRHYVVSCQRAYLKAAVSSIWRLCVVAAWKTDSYEKMTAPSSSGSRSVASPTTIASSSISIVMQKFDDGVPYVYTRVIVPGSTTGPF